MKYIITLVLVISLFAESITAFAITVTGKGTKDEPFTFVDYSDPAQSFEDWAKAGNGGNGYYFAPDCTFKNLTTLTDKTFIFLPVYDPVKKVTVSAGSGTIGGEGSAEIEVNFEDGTIAAEKELVEQDENLKLGTVLAGLNGEKAPKLEGYFPYFYEFDESLINKRLYFAGSVPAEMAEDTTAKPVSDAVYDRAGSLYVVFSDTENAAAWKPETIEAAKMIAFLRGYTKEQYAEKFGGLTATLPYGTFTVKKELPGAKNLAYAWTLKLGEVTKKTGNQETFAQQEIAKDLDGAKLTEVIQYGPGKCYSLSSEAIEYVVYARPVVSGATIK